MNTQSQAYRDYLIKVNPLTGDVIVEKDGHHITTTSDIDSAKRAIELITND